MNSLAHKAAEHYTWDEYRTWPDDERWELVDGEAVAMTAAPTTRHQIVSARLLLALAPYFHGRQCQVLAAPLDVRLADDTVLEPDLLVVCDPTRIRRTHVEGPPTLVVEILSDDSIAHDRVRKLNVYARFGVPEYWLVTPFPGLIEVMRLRSKHYVLHAGFTAQETLTSPSFPGLEVPLAGVFNFPLTAEERLDVLKETPSGYVPRPPPPYPGRRTPTAPAVPAPPARRRAPRRRA